MTSTYAECCMTESTTTLDLSEVPTRDMIAMLHVMLARWRVATRLAGLSREPIQ